MAFAMCYLLNMKNTTRPSSFIGPLLLSRDLHGILTTYCIYYFLTFLWCRHTAIVNGK